MTTEKVGRPKAFNSVEEMQIKIDKYFKYCDSKTEILPDGKYKYKPYTISGLCLYLNITRETLNEYSKTIEFSDTISKAKNKIENWLEENSLAGITNPTVSMFNLKNNFGWKDKTEVEQTNITLAEKIKQAKERQQNNE